MTILAIDLGTTTGYALRTAAGTIQSGIWSFKPSRFEGGGMRFLKFKRQLDAVRAEHQDLRTVYFEAVRAHAGVDAAHAYGGFLGHLTAWCEQHEIPYEGVGVGTIKKSFVGQGNASKEQMISEAVRRGHSPATDDEADAIAILLMKTDGDLLS